MGAQGTAELDFGAHPGATHATVAVTGQAAILAGSLVEAWVRPEATTDHSADEHTVENLIVKARDIVAGTGFTIHGVEGPCNGKSKLWGKWSIAWVWN